MTNRDRPAAHRDPETAQEADTEHCKYFTSLSIKPSLHFSLLSPLSPPLFLSLSSSYTHTIHLPATLFSPFSNEQKKKHHAISLFYFLYLTHTLSFSFLLLLNNNNNDT
jgi:hypothetical protein